MPLHAPPHEASPQPVRTPNHAPVNPMLTAGTFDIFSIGRWLLGLVAFVLFLLVAAATFPMIMGDRTVVIVSGSMEPSIPTGAAVIAQPVSSQVLRLGDVIVYSPNASAMLPIVHRIVKIRDEN